MRRFFGRLYGLRGAELNERVGTVLDIVALLDRADERVDRYSGGMKVISLAGSFQSA